jgi:hypothetical protein
MNYEGMFAVFNEHNDRETGAPHPLAPLRMTAAEWNTEQRLQHGVAAARTLPKRSWWPDSGSASSSTRSPRATEPPATNGSWTADSAATRTRARRSGRRVHRRPTRGRTKRQPTVTSPTKHHQGRLDRHDQSRRASAST